MKNRIIEIFAATLATAILGMVHPALRHYVKTKVCSCEPVDGPERKRKKDMQDRSREDPSTVLAAHSSELNDCRKRGTKRSGSNSAVVCSSEGRN